MSACWCCGAPARRSSSSGRPGCPRRSGERSWRPAASTASTHATATAPRSSTAAPSRSTGWSAAGAAGGRSGWPPPTPTGSCSPAPCRPIPDDIFDAFRTLATQWSLAHANCRVHTELAHRAHHDQLTGLPNRTLFFQRLAAAFDAATDAAEDTIALLIVDLDDFKQVNDVHGHPTGDELLVEVAAPPGRAGDGRRRSSARFGGDEFALLLTGLTASDHADEVADRLRSRACWSRSGCAA